MKKRKFKNKIYLFIFALTLFSCEKKEIAIQPHANGETIVSHVSLGTDYRYQMFFDLETNSMVKQNFKTGWDLGFECGNSGSRVILNTAKSMFSYNSGITDFNSVSDTIGLTQKWDAVSGDLDSTSIGDWSNNNVYIIDRGYNEAGTHLGFKKSIFNSVNSTEYNLKYADLDGSNEVLITVPKDNNYNFSFLSMNGNGSIADIQPKKEDWDLVFTQYVHVFLEENPPLPYLVTGALLNRNNVESCRVFDKDFDLITMADVSSYTFYSYINTIGYDWKFYSFDTGQYVVHANQNYIIKSTEGKYFKLHFIDFYDENGEKGTPTFEFQEL